MKLDPAVKKESGLIALGTLALCGVFNLGFFIVSLLTEKAAYDYTVPLGSLYGAAFSILNFFLMALTVQKALNVQDDTKKRMQLSFSVRMLLLVIVLGLGVYLPYFHWLGVLTAAVFPRIVIFFRGIYLRGHPEPVPEGAPPAENGGDD